MPTEHDVPNPPNGSRNSPLALTRAAYKAAMRLPPEDLMVVDWLAAFAASNLLSGSQARVWGFLTGPSGSGKTEALLPMFGLPYTYVLNTLTEKSLVSGLDKDDGVDYSSVPDMDGKLVLMPEFTTVMRLPNHVSGQIMAQLRTLYDGLPSGFNYGTGRKEYHVRFGVMACVTTAIDDFLATHSELGERFLKFRLFRSGVDEDAILDWIAEGSERKARWRRTLNESMKALLDPLVDRQPEPFKAPSTDTGRAVLKACARVVAKTRSIGPAWKPDQLQDPETATRLMEQLKNLGYGRAIIEGRDTWNSDDLEFVKRVARDTIPLDSYYVLRALFRNPGRTSSDLGRLANVSGPRTGQILRQFRHGGLVEQDATYHWRLSEVGQELTECSGLLDLKKPRRIKESS